MTTIIEPTQQQLSNLVSPYLDWYSRGKLAFAIGYASKSFTNCGGIYTAGSVQNQFGQSLPLDGNTLFELASVSKTFTATLYAAIIRSADATLTVADYLAPDGPLEIDPQLGAITLDQLVNYSSGLPADNEDDPTDVPDHLPRPYSEAAMLSFLDSPKAPALQGRGTTYTYSNLAFALMGAILGSARRGKPPSVHSFQEAMRAFVFEPLCLQCTFFDKAPLDQLVLGYDVDKGGALAPASPGWEFFPSYFAAGGIVASPNDMWQWLLFNMGITTTPLSSPALLGALQEPSTPARWGTTQLGLGWFLTPASTGVPAAVWKDGDLDGFNTYIAFLPSTDPGKTASEAGVFVLVNADGLSLQGQEVVQAIAWDLLLLMQGEQPPEDKSVYPKAALRRKRASRS